MQSLASNSNRSHSIHIHWTHYFRLHQSHSIQYHRGPLIANSSGGPINQFHRGMANFSAYTYLEISNSFFEATGVTFKGDRREIFLPRIESPDVWKMLKDFRAVIMVLRCLRAKIMWFFYKRLHNFFKPQLNHLVISSVKINIYFVGLPTLLKNECTDVLHYDLWN